MGKRMGLEKGTTQKEQEKVKSRLGRDWMARKDGDWLGGRNEDHCGAD